MPKAKITPIPTGIAAAEATPPVPPGRGGADQWFMVIGVIVLVIAGVVLYHMRKR